jgi:O-antigen ligase
VTEFATSAGGFALIGGAFLLLVWFVLPGKPASLPRYQMVFVFALTYATILPGAVNLVVQLGALVGAYAIWILTSSDVRRGSAVVGWVTAIIVCWILLSFHPNVPSLDTGLLGFRKSVLAFAGIVLGCAIARPMIEKFERLIIGALASALSVSIFGYYFVPSIEQLVSRAAGEYTSLYAGQARLQGIFAGPFHVSAAGVLLVCWVIVRWREHRFLALLYGAIGLVSVYLSLVRSAYVALAIVIVAAVLFSPVATTVFRRAAIVFVGAIGIYSVSVYTESSLFATAQSISNFSTDGRFLNRLPGYERGLGLVEASPLYGWGSGSAGDTMGGAFTEGAHVTSHNILLKFAVEGGFIGVFLIVGLFVVLCRRLPAGSAQARLGVLAGVSLLGFGISLSAIETLPVSYFVMAMIGLGVRDRFVGAIEVESPAVKSAG